ncbi:MAG: hypothetical protein ALECFALPRED_010923 [Alectoria fallacina]|uniref:Uncharacterized protein n=1 Tax=Alectoria fallacina TaxID=1903189 RepID=A0A8H3J9Q7_9LECA|nr:MAG: hypothetical protein ALECFALPRED_010923 [Alectoria fallacina]
MRIYIKTDAARHSFCLDTVGRISKATLYQSEKPTRSTSPLNRPSQPSKAIQPKSLSQQKPRQTPIMPTQPSSPGAHKLRSTVRKLVQKIKPSKEEGPMPGELDSTDVQLARFFGRPVSSSSTADATASLTMAEATSNGARDSLRAASPDVRFRSAKRGSRGSFLDVEMSG